MAIREAQKQIVELFMDGTVFRDGPYYCGKAPDGSIVFLGEFGNVEGVQRLLAKYTLQEIADQIREEQRV